MSKREKLFYYLLLPLILVFKINKKLNTFLQKINEIKKVTKTGKNLICGNNLQIFNKGMIRIGDNVQMGNNIKLIAYAKGKISIGNNSVISDGCFIIAGSSHIEIGNDCLIGEYTSIRASNHGTSSELKIRSQSNINKKVTIGNDVWIGRGCAIAAGSTLKFGVVIGANSFVGPRLKTKENSIYGGNPAHFLKARFL